MLKNLKDPESLFINFDTPTLLKSFFNVAFNSSFAFACYRLPLQNSIRVVIDLSSQVSSYSVNDLSQQKGFVVSPFVITERSALLIQADLEWDVESNKLSIKEGKESEAEIYLDKVFQLNSNFSVSSYDYEASEEENNDSNFIDINSKAIDAIRNGKFKKVVLARKKSIPLPSGFHPVDLFTSINNELKESFNSLVFIPGQGIWIGASPEVLVSVDKMNVFRTVALAGTQRAKPEEESNVVWTQKEIEEQALVVRYILNCFKSIRLREYEDDGPKTVKAGNLFHLKTDFSVNLNEVDYPNLGITMLKLLHPTSAVCGMPKEEALSFIRDHEGLDRKFYSGFLGPLNLDDETHLFVNIRCAQIEGNEAHLYSGAGVTSESKPEKELEETSLKMQLLENLIKTKR